MKAGLFDPHRLDARLSREFAARLRRDSGLERKKIFAAFEAELAAAAGRRLCLLTESGRTALKIALLALGVKPGRRVGMTNLTHPSAPEAAIWAGAKPAYLEISPDNLNLDLDAAEKKAGRLDALLITHMFSASCGAGRAERLAAANKIPLLEDASQIIGESSGDRPYGSFGDASVFSLSPYKPVSCPGRRAGALLCDDKVLFRRIKAAAAEFGAPPPEAVPLLRLKLELLPKTLAGLRSINSFYRRELSGLPGLYLPAAGAGAHEFPVLARRRAALEAGLAAKGIPLERVYEPFSRAAGFPACAAYSRQALHLPAYPDMTEAERTYVARTLKALLA